MKCPNCGGEQNCPCASCSDKNSNKVVWVWITDNGPIGCGHCGHTMTEDEWDSEGFEQYKAD